MKFKKKTTSLGDAFYLSLLRTHEEAMAELYEMYAEKLSCCPKLWRDLRQQELQHAKVLHELEFAMKTGKAQIDRNGHPSHKVKISLDSLQPRIRTWRTWGLTKKEAFEYALLMEGAFIEKTFFVPAPGDSEEVRKTFTMIETGSANHFKLLEDEYYKNVPSANIVKFLTGRVKDFFRLNS